MLKRTALLSLLLLITASATATMPMHMGHESALGASAAFAPNGRLWVVSVRDEHALLRHSDDRGKTLSPAATVNTKPEPISASGENRPKIALSPNGAIYITWTQPLAKPYTGRIRFARSLDAGKHFSAPITVHHDRGIITHRFDALAVDDNGNILVTWIDKRDLNAAEAVGKPYLGAAIYAAWSSDGGASFAPEHKLQDHSCECCRIAHSADAAGSPQLLLWKQHAYAAWNTRAGFRLIAADTSP